MRAASAFEDASANRHAVENVFVQAENCEQDHLLELAERAGRAGIEHFNDRIV